MITFTNLDGTVKTVDEPTARKMLDYIGRQAAVWDDTRAASVTLKDDKGELEALRMITRLGDVRAQIMAQLSE